MESNAPVGTNNTFFHSPVKISGITTGKIVDYGIHDSLNMGAAMAPAAADTIAAHFADFVSKPEEYDRIPTEIGTVSPRWQNDWM